VTACGRPAENPADQYAATVAVRVAASVERPDRVQAFLARFDAYGLGSIPGFYVDLATSVGAELRRVDYWPGLVRLDEPHHEAVLADGRRIPVSVPETEPPAGQPEPLLVDGPVPTGDTRTVPLGRVAYARSGTGAVTPVSGCGRRRPVWSIVESVPLRRRISPPVSVRRNRGAAMEVREVLVVD
jgi:hypothetical protein